MPEGGVADARRGDEGRERPPRPVDGEPVAGQQPGPGERVACRPRGAASDPSRGAGRHRSAGTLGGSSYRERSRCTSPGGSTPSRVHASRPGRTPPPTPSPSGSAGSPLVCVATGPGPRSSSGCSSRRAEPLLPRPVPRRRRVPRPRLAAAAAPRAVLLPAVAGRRPVRPRLAERAAGCSAIGAGLIALCHLPVPFAVRVAARRPGRARPGRAAASSTRPPFWPVLGSMFMFRLIVYLYDLRRRPGRPAAAAHGWPTSSRCRTSASCSSRSSTSRRSARRTAPTPAGPRPGRGRVDRPRAVAPAGVPGRQVLRPAAPRTNSATCRTWPCSWPRTTPCTCTSPGTSTSSRASSTCSGSSCRAPTTTTSWRRASPTSGGGSTSTGRTS